MIPADVFAETLLGFLEPVRPFLDDPSVTEIMINGPDQIYIERSGRIERTDARFEGREALLAALRNAAQFVGKSVDEHRPILEGRLPDGSRIEAILPPAAPDGPHVAIRRFSKHTLTIDRLVALGALTQEAASILEAFVVAKLNVLVAGGTGSGKTSLLAALSAFVPESERVVVIEDARELQIPREHVVQLEARPPDPRGRGVVSVRDLFRATLRMRPDRVIIGEIRGGEALDLIQAMTSGHGGCLGTLHATYPRDTLGRLETMALMSDLALPLSALRMQIASAIDVVVQVSRRADGARLVTHVTAVEDFDLARGEYRLVDLFARRGAELAPTGARPRLYDRLESQGFALPAVDEGKGSWRSS